MHRFPNSEVGHDLHIVFWEKGRMVKSRLAPDVLVALCVPRRSTRAEYDVDELGPPDFVLEVLSRSTWKHDVGRKLNAYQKIGVRECLLFDVTGENLAGLGRDLWGFSLTPEGRQPLEERVLPNGERGVWSPVLGLVAYVAARTPPAAHNETWALTMRWHDPATEEDIPDYEELRERQGRVLTGEERALAVEQMARSRADAAERVADAAWRRVAELEARLGLRGGP